MELARFCDFHDLATTVVCFPAMTTASCRSSRASNGSEHRRFAQLSFALHTALRDRRRSQLPFLCMKRPAVPSPRKRFDQQCSETQGVVAFTLSFAFAGAMVEGCGPGLSSPPRSLPLFFFRQALCFFSLSLSLYRASLLQHSQKGSAQRRPPSRTGGVKTRLAQLANLWANHRQSLRPFNHNTRTLGPTTCLED